MRSITKRFTRGRNCQTQGCGGRADYIEKQAPGRSARVQLCSPCAAQLGKIQAAGQTRRTS